MKKVPVVLQKRRLYSLIFISVALVVISIGLIMHIQSLSSRIAILENKETAFSKTLASYKRSLCSHSDSKQLATLTKYDMRSGGYDRSYQVHTPSNYDPSVRYPVIFSFDGIEGSGDRMEGYAGLDALPALIVYPDPLPGSRGFASWEGAPYSINSDRDTQFVHDLLETLPSKYCVDSTQQFAVGMSNGGSFATIVGCEFGDAIRAVASVSGAFYTTCKEQQRTPSLLLIHSSSDKQVPLYGSPTRQLPNVPLWVDAQAVERRCNTKNNIVTIDTAISYAWQECIDNSSLVLTVTDTQPHGWLSIPQTSGQKNPGTAGYIWDFFKQSTYR
jgi:polyhydroxybutyrate depolymerase